MTDAYRFPGFKPQQIVVGVKELHLDWKTVKSLEKEYMLEQLRRSGNPASKIIGIDEIAIHQRSTIQPAVTPSQFNDDR